MELSGSRQFVQFRHNFYLYIAKQNMNIGTIYIHIQEYSVYNMYVHKRICHIFLCKRINLFPTDEQISPINRKIIINSNT